MHNSYRHARSRNMAALLQKIIEHGPITKRDLQYRSQLSWGTVSTHTAELIDRKFVIEEKAKHGDLMGRTPFLLDVSNVHNLVVGIDVNLDGVTSVLTDLRCRVLKKAVQPIKAYEPNIVLDAISCVIEGLIPTAGSISNIIGIGLALPGNVDQETGMWTYRYAPNVVDFSICRRLQERYHCHVVIDHDPNCIARAEQTVGIARGFENFVLVRLSTGIGASLVVNNQVYQGSHKAAGEFGHICIAVEGPLCRCGKKGCLEAYSSKHAVLGDAQALAQRADTDSVLVRIYGEKGQLTLDDLFYAADTDDKEAIEILENAARYLGIAIANLVNVLDPRCVILWGDLATSKEHFVDVVRNEVDKHANTAYTFAVEVSSLGQEGASIGAAALIVDDILQGIYPALEGI